MKSMIMIACLIVLLITAGCGGGGSSETPSQPKPPVTNSPPVANNVSLTIDEDTVGTGSISASDADGDTLSYSVTSAMQNGTLVVNSDGTFSYTPNANYYGEDSANVEITDGTDITIISISITINDVHDNSPPSAAISAALDEITASIKVNFDASESSDPDTNDELNYKWQLDVPDYSLATISNESAEVISVRPDAIGEYTLSLTVTDSSGASDTTTISFVPKIPTPMALPEFTPSPPPAGYVKDQNDAVRLLQQASFGATVDSLTELQELGAEAWFQKQMTMTPTLWVDLRKIITEVTGDAEIGPNGETQPNGREWIAELMDMTAYDAPDQLRQRIAFTLSQLFVVSTKTNLGHRDIAFTTYWDVLSTHAFGNFRDLLERVSLHPTMGHYLNMIGNQKANPALNIRPDENFAREVMQLFTIGTAELNQDGSVKLDENGEPIETYNQIDIQNYAAALTGWYYYDPNIEQRGRQFYSDFGCGVHCHPLESSGKRMVPYEHIHQKTEKQLLRGYYVPPGQSARDDLKIVLDSLFNHPNLGPFIASHLIRQLVTSNPSPDYVARVSAVFNNNGQGVRGDLGATVKAVLFDTEARQPSEQLTLFGKVKEPLLMQYQVARLLDVFLLSPEGDYSESLWTDTRFSPLGTSQRPQNALHAESVFNFFRPNFAPNGDISQMGLVAPEMQIVTEASVVWDTQLLSGLKSQTIRESELARYNAGAETGWTPEIYSPGFVPDHLDEAWETQGYTGVIEFFNLYLTAGGMTQEYKNALLGLTEHPDYAHVFDGKESYGDPFSSDLVERHYFYVDLMYMIVSSPEFRVQQ